MSSSPGRPQAHQRSTGRGQGGWRGRDVKRSMDLVASVSRSSGLEKDGDILKGFKVQDEYFQFIRQKLAQLSPLGGAERTDKRRNEEENILILFRKLREGISTSSRHDDFALKVYEMSLFLSAIFGSSKQLSSIVPQLPQLYAAVPTDPQTRRLEATLTCLLHYLVDSYPLQGVYQQHLDTIPPSFLPKSSEARTWISSVSAALRTHNYIRFEELTRSDVIVQFCNKGAPSSATDDLGALAKHALYTIVDALRRKSRDATWNVLRSSYREWSCQPEYELTSNWLERSLVLRSVAPNVKSISVDEWLATRAKEGHVRPKEGVEGRWLVYRQK